MRVDVIWASQTGTSEAIAKQIYNKLQETGQDAAVTPMNRFNLLAKPQPLIIVYVTSSTGSGDPPDNGIKFISFLKRAQRQLTPESTLPLSGVHYTILGLGDSNYTSYQYNPRNLDKTMAALGAQTFYKRGEADESRGLEEQVEAWITGLWEPLKETVKIVEAGPSAEQSPVQTPQPAESQPIISQTAPVEEPTAQTTESTIAEASAPVEVIPVAEPPVEKKPAPKKKIQIKQIPDVPKNIIELASTSVEPVFFSDIYGPKRNDGHLLTITGARWLTTSAAIKQTVEVSFDLPGEFPDYLPGDSIAIYTHNSHQLVESLLNRIEVNGDNIFQITGPDVNAIPSNLLSLSPCSVKQLFLWAVDVTSLPKKTFLRMLGEYCSDKTEADRLILLSSVKGKKDFEEFFSTPKNLLDILNAFPSCKPEVTHLLSTLPALKPRYYSHSSASSPSKKGKIVFSLVGICTHWLVNLLLHGGLLADDGRFQKYPFPFDVNQPLQLIAAHSTSAKFHLPDPISESKPIVMIGPGTGVAPFLGFLEHLQSLKQEKNVALPPTWLFFGCRNQDDFIFKNEFEAFGNENILNNFHVTFSREGGTITYVQHKLLEISEQVYNLIENENALIYVCGDVTGMLAQVTDVLGQIVGKHKDIPAPEAKNYITSLIKADRLIFDVWL